MDVNCLIVLAYIDQRIEGNGGFGSGGGGRGEKRGAATDILCHWCNWVYRVLVGEDSA